MVPGDAPHPGWCQCTPPSACELALSWGREGYSLGVRAAGPSEAWRQAVWATLCPGHTPINTEQASSASQPGVRSRRPALPFLGPSTVRPTGNTFTPTSVLAFYLVSPEISPARKTCKGKPAANHGTRALTGPPSSGCQWGPSWPAVVRFPGRERGWQPPGPLVLAEDSFLLHTLPRWPPEASAWTPKPSAVVAVTRHEGLPPGTPGKPGCLSGWG